MLHKEPIVAKEAPPEGCLQKGVTPGNRPLKSLAAHLSTFLHKCSRLSNCFNIVCPHLKPRTAFIWGENTCSPPWLHPQCRHRSQAAFAEQFFSSNVSISPCSTISPRMWKTLACCSRGGVGENSLGGGAMCWWTLIGGMHLLPWFQLCKIHFVFWSFGKCRKERSQEKRLCWVCLLCLVLVWWLFSSLFRSSI